jgi:hypothetical protein
MSFVPYIKLSNFDYSTIRHIVCKIAKCSQYVARALQGEPPGEMALLEWRAQKTVNALVTLHGYEKI